MPPARVHHTQGCVTVFQVVRQNTYSANIEQLIKLQMLFLHFAPNRVDVLRASVNVRINTLLSQRVLQLRDKIINILLAVGPTLMQAFGNGFIGIRVQIAKGDVFQLPFQLAYA